MAFISVNSDGINNTGNPMAVSAGVSITESSLRELVKTMVFHQVESHQSDISGLIRSLILEEARDSRAALTDTMRAALTIEGRAFEAATLSAVETFIQLEGDRLTERLASDLKSHVDAEMERIESGVRSLNEQLGLYCAEKVDERIKELKQHHEASVIVMEKNAMERYQVNAHAFANIFKELNEIKSHGWIDELKRTASRIWKAIFGGGR